MQKVSANDRNVLRELAKEYMDIAVSDEMKIRKRQWTALHDLKPERPMILFVPFWLEGFLNEGELYCEDQELRNLERRIKTQLVQYHNIGDDVTFEPYIRIGWFKAGLSVNGFQYGDIKIEEHGAKDASMAYLSNFPIANPFDIERMEYREYSIDKKITLDYADRIKEIIGDIIPVVVGGFDNFFIDIGNQPFTGAHFIGITWNLFKLIGAENMAFWVYDYPDELKKLCEFLVQDKTNFYNFAVREGLLDFCTDNQIIGPSSYGYVSDLPQIGTEKRVELKDLWCWAESQETQMISPEMFKDVYLPHVAKIANMFGHSYYGCCERIDDRFEFIKKAIHNIRTVSVSGWNDFGKVGEVLGKDYVFSRKPTPAYVSTKQADWDMVEKDVVATKDAAKNCCLEVIFMDIYSANCTKEIAAQWVNKYRTIIGF